jgi:NADPH:quinone reductase
VLRKRLTITGSTLRARPISFKGQIAQALLTKIWPLLEAKTIKPVIHTVFLADSVDGAVKAHALMESNQHVGKLVLEWTI